MEHWFFSFERNGRHVLWSVSIDNELLNLMAGNHKFRCDLLAKIFNGCLTMCIVCGIYYSSTPYLFWALLLFHTIANNNVNNFPPEPLNYSLKAALLPCRGIDSRMLDMQSGTQTLAGNTKHRQIGSKTQVDKSPFKTPHLQNRAQWTLWAEHRDVIRSTLR